jgi:hypothetical protein
MKVDKIKMTYSRKNAVAPSQKDARTGDILPSETEDLFYTEEITIESQDDIEQVANSHFEKACLIVDRNSGKDSTVIKRSWTVTDKNDRPIDPKKEGEHKEQPQGEAPKGPPTRPPEKPTPPDKTPMGDSPAKRGQSKLEQLTAEQIRRELKAWLEKNRLELIPSWLYGSDRIVIEAYDQMQCHGIHGWSAFIAQLEKQYPKEI